MCIITGRLEFCEGMCIVLWMNVVMCITDDRRSLDVCNSMDDCSIADEWAALLMTVV